MNILSSFKNIYPFLMYIIPVIIGIATMGASAYGIGKNEKTTDTPEYKASVTFFIIGLVISLVTIVSWYQGNFLSGQCDSVVYRTAEACKPLQTEIETCNSELLKLKMEIAKSVLESKTKLIDLV